MPYETSSSHIRVSSCKEQGACGVGCGAARCGVCTLEKPHEETSCRRRGHFSCEDHSPSRPPNVRQLSHARNPIPSLLLRLRLHLGLHLYNLPPPQHPVRTHTSQHPTLNRKQNPKLTSIFFFSLRSCTAAICSSTRLLDIPSISASFPRDAPLERNVDQKVKKSVRKATKPTSPCRCTPTGH